MKIRLQITSIEVNLIAFSLAYVRCSRREIDQISQRFVINPASIRSKLSLGCRRDHEEFTILLQNCLISSRFNQELSYIEEEHRFIEEIALKSRGQLDSVKTNRRPRSCHNSGPRSHDSAKIAHPILIRRP